MSAETPYATLDVISEDGFRLVVRRQDGQSDTYFQTGAHPTLALRVSTAFVQARSHQSTSSRNPLESLSPLRVTIKVELEVVRSAGMCLIERRASMCRRIEGTLLVPTQEEREALTQWQQEHRGQSPGESAALIEWQQQEDGSYLWSSRFWLRDDVFQYVIDGLRQRNLEGIYIGVVSKDFYTTELAYDPDEEETLFIRPRSFEGGQLVGGLSYTCVNTLPTTLASGKW